LTAESRLVGFYRGDGTDSEGRRFDEVLSWNDQLLEGVHDYIQWLFPLDEPSAFNSDAPLVTAADRAAFASNPTLAQNLRRALSRMLAFYGFQLVETDTAISVERAPTWASQSRIWLHPHNHNFLRQTRIVKSLTLLGQSELARAFGDVLVKEFERAPAVIGRTTAGYWKDAISRTCSRTDARRP
jgi:opioid growth factor receptor-like protein